MHADSADEQREVIVRAVDGMGRLTLNRPAAINAVTARMVDQMQAALDAWAQDGSVHAVLVDGAGSRGLCAGGDIVSIYRSLLAGTPDAADFWRAEYDLVRTIASYPKPYIAVMDGLVLGGGVGLSAHGSLRIVTERSKVGLTQVNIGFIPDIGGSWLMARAPGELGTFAALTGAQLGPADAITCGLADVCVASESLPELIACLSAAGPAEHSAIVGRYAIEPPPGVRDDDQDWIDEAFAADDLDSILTALSGRPEAAAQQAATRLAGLSPTSLEEALGLIRAAADLTLDEAIEAEYAAALRVAAGPDLREGIRSQVIDKDRNPQWAPR